MATDAKIDKLVASIEKLVASMAASKAKSSTSGKSSTAEKQKDSVETKADKLLDKELATLERLRDTDKDRKVIIDEITRLRKEALEDQRESGVLNEEELKAAAKEIEKQEDLLENLDKQKQITEDTKENNLDILSATFGISRGLGASLKTAGALKAKFEGFRKTVSAIFSREGFLNLGLSVMKSMVFNTGKAVVQFDAATASLNAMSGAAGELDGLVESVAIDSNHLGVGFEESAQAIQGLISTVTRFRDLSASSQKELTTFTAQMGNLGVGAETLGTQFSALTSGMGMLPDEAIAVQKEMMATAVALKMPPQQMAEGFSEALPYLASFGKEAPKIFAKVATGARALGVDVGTLISMTEQFDTFEGAASAAGSLNAVLGGSLLNSVDLLNASTDERIKMVLGSVEASGKEWSAMNRFEQKAIAATVGITDMNEANKLFGGGLSAYEDAQSELEATAVSQEDLAAAQKSSLTLTKKLAHIWNMFTVKVKWFTDIASGALTMILEFNKEHPRMTTAIIGVVAALTALIAGLLVLAKVTATVTAAMATLKSIGLFGGTIRKAIPAIKEYIKNKWALVTAERAAAKASVDSSNVTGGSGKKFGETLKNIGKAARKAAPTLIQVGVAFLLIGAGVGLAAWGVAQFVMAFSGMEPGQILAVSVALLVFLGAMVAIVVALTALAASGAGPIAVGLMLALGGAFLLIGGGIALAAMGIGDMVQHMSSLGSAMSPVLSAVSTLAFAFGALMLAIANPLAMGALAALALSIGALSLALWSIPEEKTVAFTNVIDSVVRYSNATAEPNIENVERMIELAGEYQEVQSEMKLPALDSFVTALKSLSGADKSSTSSTSTSTSSGGNNEVVLVLNDREFGRAVFEAMGNKMKNVVLDQG